MFQWRLHYPIFAYVFIGLMALPVSVSASAQCATLWEISAGEGFSAPNRVQDIATGKTLGIAVSKTDTGLVLIRPDGTIAWQVALQPPVNAAPAVCDLDGDGREEIIDVDCVGHVVCVNLDGKTLWKVKLPDGITGWGNPAAADINGDGKAEVVIGDRGGNVSCLSHDGRLLWRFQGEVGELGTPLLADIYNTPGLEVVITSHEQDIYALDSKGNWLWDVHIPNDLFPNSTPVLADIDGNGESDLFIGGGLNHLIQINPATLEVHLFETDQHINDVISVADLNHNGRETVLAGNKSGNLFAYGSAGTSPQASLLWQFDLLSHGPILAAPLLLNLDEDPDTEALLLTASSNLITALNPNGTVAWQQEYKGGSASLAPCAGDIDGDGTLDLVLTQRPSVGGTGSLRCISLGIPYREKKIRWGCIAANPANTCRSKTQLPHKPLPVPQRRKSQVAKRAPCKITGTFNLFTGPNTWRRKITAPTQGRVVLLTEIISPSGPRFLSAKHTQRNSDLLRIDFEVSEKGAYKIRESLLNADSRTELTARKTTITLTPFKTDLAHITTLLAQTKSIFSGWKKANPTVQQGCERRRRSLTQEVTDLSTGSPGQKRQSARIHELTETRKAVEQFRALTRTINADSAQHTFLTWTASPWSYFNPTESLPTQDSFAKQIEIRICQREYEPAILNLTNVCGKTLEVRVIPSDLKGPETLKVAEHMELRRAVSVPTAWRQEVTDALPLLDQGRLITLPPWESAQLWITFNAGEAKPGTYQGALRLMSLEVDPSVIEVPVSLTVYNLGLPRPRPLRFCTWSYITQPFKDVKEAVRQDLIAHADTVFFPPCPKARFDKDGRLLAPIDYKEHDEFIRAYAPYGFILFLSPQSQVRGPKFLSDAWKRAYATYLKDWVGHLDELGVGYQDFALYPYDEPNVLGSKRVNDLIAVGQATRATDPNILIYADPTTGSTVELIKALAPVIDIWCPSAELLERRGDELIPLFKKTGKEVWFYDAAGHSKTLSTLGIYRWRPWEAWRLGFTGCGHWVYSAHSDDLWLGPNPSANYYPTVYDGKGVVSSKRWEACREGAEDYEYLSLLRNRIRAAKKNGVAEQRIMEAQKVLDRADTITALLKDVGRRIPLSPDGIPRYEKTTKTLNAYRKEVVEGCLSLK